MADRLIGALRKRPRLAISHVDQPLLRAFMPALRARVEAEVDGLLANIGPGFV